MATLSKLDPAGEALVQSLERESGVWAVAYAPQGVEAEPPGYAARLKPAQLDDEQVRKVQEAERRTGSVIVAYEPIGNQ